MIGKAFLWGLDCDGNLECFEAGHEVFGSTV